MATIQTPADGTYKGFFSDLETMRSFLAILPDDFVQLFDLSTLESCKGTFTIPWEDEQLQRHDDLLWRLKLRTGRDCYVYTILEFQSEPEYFMPFRMLAYTALMYQDLVKTRVLKTKTPVAPLVFPIVVYNGDAPWNGPVRVQDFFRDIPQGLAKYQPQQEMYLLNMQNFVSAGLQDVQSRAAWIIKLERVKNTHELHKYLTELEDALTDQAEYTGFRRAVAAWSRWIAHRLNVEIPPFTLAQDPKEMNKMVVDRLLQSIEREKDEIRKETTAQVTAQVSAQAKSQALEADRQHVRNLKRLGLSSELLAKEFSMPLDVVEAL